MPSTHSKRLLLFLAGMLSLCSPCTAQGDFCDTLKPKPLACLADSLQSWRVTVAMWQDEELLLRCSAMDSLDAVIWKHSDFWLNLQVTSLAEERPFTYGEALHLMDSIIRAPGYSRRKQAIARGHRPVDESRGSEPVATIRRPYAFRPFQSLNACLAEARPRKKRVLLYFTAHRSDSSRKMEHWVLSEDPILYRIDSGQQAYVLYTDDETPGSRTGGKTRGEEATALWSHTFGCDRLPCFVLLDAEGRVLRKENYLEEPADFYYFLRWK